MAAVLLLEEQVEIPADVRSLADFRRWVRSDDFPERGRIDYLRARIEVDMSPEDFFCHGTLKTEIIGVLHEIVKQGGLGHLVSDRTRVSAVEADMSAEPDIVFVSHQSLESGAVRMIPKSSGELGRYIELEGAPDLIVEIVSDSSVEKDTARLPDAYFKAGVREFWLADARGEPLWFQIHQPGAEGFRPVPPDAEGYQHSAVFGRRFRLDGSRDERRHWSFDLRQRIEN